MKRNQKRRNKLNFACKEVIVPLAAISYATRNRFQPCIVFLSDQESVSKNVSDSYKSSTQIFEVLN